MFYLGNWSFGITRSTGTVGAGISHADRNTPPPTMAAVIRKRRKSENFDIFRCYTPVFSAKS